MYKYMYKCIKCGILWRDRKSATGRYDCIQCDDVAYEVNGSFPGFICSRGDTEEDYL